jgi:tripartite-type tricarboxylate transporter receptor subunit TctC
MDAMTIVHVPHNLSGRRGLLCALFVGLLLAAPSIAQTYPSKPVRIFVTTPGSILDVVARQLSDKLAPALGQPVIVENKASAIIAMEATAKSAPDGYSLVVAPFTQLAVTPYMYERLPYDPVRDFAPVILLYKAPLLLAAQPSLPANSVKDLIQLAKAQPGKLTYSSSGNGQPPHVYTELFKFNAGIEMVHVPYKGTATAVAALIAGDVNLNMESASAVIPHVKSGRIKALAVTGERHIASLPDVQTFAEAGVPGIGDSWVGIVAPAGTPRDIILRLNREIAKALESQDIKTYYDNAGRSVVASSPEAFAEVISNEISKWREVVKKTGITPG